MHHSPLVEEIRQLIDAARQRAATAVNAEISRLYWQVGHQEKQQAFLEFVLGEYIREGVEELDPAKLPGLLELKYGNTYEATEQLGNVSMIRETFVGFQGYLYAHPNEKR